MGTLTPDDLAIIDLKAGWPAADIAEAVAIEEDQSSGNPTEIGWDNNGKTVADTSGLALPSVPYSSYDTGDFQINSSSDPGGPLADPAWMTKMEDPVANAQQALSMFNARGWEPWQSPSGQLYSPQDLALGQGAIGDVAAATPAQLTNAWGWIWDHFGTFGKHNVPMQKISGAAGGAIAKVIPSFNWRQTALELGGGLAGATLVILGLYAAAKPAQQKAGGISPVKDAAKAAAL